MVETYRCIHCSVEIEGAQDWIGHINSSEHRTRMLRPALRTDPDDSFPTPSRSDHWD